MAAAGAALRLRLLYRMLRVGELLALVVLLSWSSSRVPSAAAAVLRLAGSLLLDPRFVFVLGNAIVILLLALSRHDLSLSSNSNSNSNSNHPATANANANANAATPTATAPAAASFPSFTTVTPPTLPPPAEALAAAPGPEVPVAAAAVFEDKQPVRVNKARAPRRSRSAKMGPRGVIRRAASPELRRSESENGRRRRSSVTARDAEGCWGLDDAEEFRRTVEAFIAKQTRFHREEYMTMAVVDGAGHGEVASAITGALAVVE